MDQSSKQPPDVGKCPPADRQPPPASSATGTDGAGRKEPAPHRSSSRDSPQHDDASSSLPATLPPPSSDAGRPSAVPSSSLLSGLGPGAYRVSGPNLPASETEGDASDVTDGRRRSPLTTASATTGGAVLATDDEEMVFEGFVPEPTPQERHEARIRREVEEMKRAAVTLDPSAVRTIDASDREQASSADPSIETGEEGGWANRLKSPLAAISLVAIVLLAVALAVAFGGGGGGSDVEDEASGRPSCTIESVRETYDVARSIVSEVTASDVLDNSTSPQAKALEWLVCEDRISSDLIEARDPATGALPAQPHGTLAGDAGEAHVLRRYVLATFHFATQADGPWGETLNFLSGDRHECAWHENKTRNNWPYGDFDPVGVVCFRPHAGYIVLDDVAEGIGRMELNLRVPNNLSGTLPLELGHLIDLNNITLESHKGLRGSLPSTLGNLANLVSFSVLFMGPDLGGTIPLFALPVIQYVTMLFNEGAWQLPPHIELVEESLLENLSFRSTGLTGALPSFVSDLRSLQVIELDGNLLEGSLPDSFGDLPYLKYLNLHGSNLKGTLPELLGQLKNITALVLGENSFEGSIPASLGNLPKLQLLDLGHNKLEGTVPASFSGLNSLEHISLQSNANLFGPISVFGSLGNLTTLALYNNSFSSTIPKGLFSGSMDRVINADLGHNNFTGGLPDAFTRHASNTSYLSLMRNSLDADVVEDAICEEVPVIFADCDSCTCCQSCCDKDSTDPNDPNCNYQLDFYWAVGLECGSWWEWCGKNTQYDPLPLE